MAEHLRNWLALARRFGWVPALHLLLLWAGRQALGYRKAFIYRLDLANIPTLPGCNRVEWGYTSPNRFVGRFEGTECYSSAVSREGFAVPDRANVSFLGTADAYVGDCITHPSHRGQGIYPCALVTLGHELAKEGRTMLYLFIEQENLASIRSVQKAGFEAIAACTVLAVGRRSRKRVRFFTKSQAGEASRWRVELPRSRQAAGQSAAGANP